MAPAQKKQKQFEHTTTTTTTTTAAAKTHILTHSSQTNRFTDTHTVADLRVWVQLSVLSGCEVAVIGIKTSLEYLGKELAKESSSIDTWLIQSLCVDQHHLQWQSQVCQWVQSGRERWCA